MKKLVLLPLMAMFPFITQAATWKLYKDIHAGENSFIMVGPEVYKYQQSGFDCEIGPPFQAFGKGKNKRWNRVIKCSKGGFEADASAMCSKAEGEEDGESLTLREKKTGEYVSPLLICIP